ncbi:tol-pal system protein YbgF [candidate division CSSED10-310 bacterium]|uniref:Tol-pal system protein YbgF n=1 Tax=candidate division CSSED10-310 bacterium TaxID=2855610 RepID=A0ABV6YUS5_UNCC1
MRPLLMAGVLVGIYLLLSGCAGLNSPSNPIMSELQKIEQKIDTNSQQQQNQIRDLERKVDQLSADLASQQKGKADGSYSLTQITQDLETIKQQLNDTTQRFNELYDKIIFLQSAVEELKHAPRLSESGTAALPQSDVTSNPETVYQMALSDFRKNNYQLAINGFQQFITSFPHTELAGNAQYWIGESYYSMKEFAQALNEFEKVLGKYPKNNKAPSALLKRAFCYLEMGKLYDCQKQLTQVTKQYPNTREAQLAEQKLQQLKR